MNPLYCKEIQPVHPKGDQSWVFIGRTDAKADTCRKTAISRSALDKNTMPRHLFEDNLDTENWPEPFGPRAFDLPGSGH